MTRERRTKGNDAPTTVSTYLDDEDQQQQEEDDEHDFDSAMTVSVAHDLLGDAIEVLDGILQQRQTTADSTTTSSSVTPIRRVTRSRGVSKPKRSSNK